jgi:ABC-2 type transport system permease protein
MQKYLAVFNISWQNGFVYRLNFILWRVRSALQLLLVYFIWWTVFQTQQQVFGYTEQTILTYILLAAIIRAIVLSSRVGDLASAINVGDIVNFLIKPLNLIKYYFAKDLADKLLNIFFVVVEITLIVLFLKPSLVIQDNLKVLGLFIVATLLGIILYFALSLIFSMTAFWWENVFWGPQFILMIFLEGFGGGLFPIDILPEKMAQILMLSPFPYLIYFPSKLYLGTLSGSEVLSGFLVLLFWTIIMWIAAFKMLNAGLKNYTAVGH